MPTELVPVEAGTPPLALLEAEPEALLNEASRAAKMLQRVISQKQKPLIINGEQYLEFEDWQTLGRFCSITAGEDGDPEYCEFGEFYGFKASAVAYDRAGRIISRATAFCMTDEERWRTAQLNHLSSMAQTRACAKVLRNVLSWVAVLGGYRPTPAEEMDGVAVAAFQRGTRESVRDLGDPAYTPRQSMSGRPSMGPQPSRAAAEWLALQPQAVRDALLVDHPIIKDMGAKLTRFGKLTDKQVKYLLDLAADAGVQYSEESYSGAEADSSATVESQVKPSGLSRMGQKVRTGPTTAAPEPPPLSDSDVPF
jgi:hypothetical protein